MGDKSIKQPPTKDLDTREYFREMGRSGLRKDVGDKEERVPLSHRGGRVQKKL